MANPEHLAKLKEGAEAKDATKFYDFGKLKEESSAAQEKVNTCIHQLLIKEDFLEDIIEMGTYDEPMAKQGVLRELVDGKK